MKRFVLIAALIGVASCAGDRRRDDVAAGATGTTGTAGTSADVDRGWILERLEEGDAEVRLGRLGQERAANADVRAFGATMVERHTVAGTELKRIANRHNVTPDAARARDDDEFEKLSKLSGRDFDRAFLEVMIEEHEDAVKAIERKAESARDHADVKDWAAKTLTEVRQHLERARNLRERLDREGDS